MFDGLDYNLFKCEHIFAGENKNLDILFNDDYSLASKLLEKEGFCLFLPEKVEKFKKMYLRFSNGELTAIHLHREVAWHGIKVLDKKPIFSESKKLAEGMNVPSAENSLLIHIAHVLFENFSIRNRELKILPKYIQENLDWDYINFQLDKNHWKKGFYYVLDRYKKNKNVEKKEIIKNYFRRFSRKPSDLIYLTEKVFRKIIRNFSLRRKGSLIALIGVNGAGKTTLSKKILENYKPLTKFLGVQQKAYYFGWQPFSPLAKIGTKLFSKKKVFKDVTWKVNERISIFQEALFVYNYLDYSLRYLFHLYPQLRKGNFVITDRYFYDLYGQYPYAKKSLVVRTLMRLFPQPSYTFILDASTELIMNRDKDGMERNYKSEAYLAGQRERYIEMNSFLSNSSVINTEKDIEENVGFIVEKSWKGVVEKLKS